MPQKKKSKETESNQGDLDGESDQAKKRKSESLLTIHLSRQVQEKGAVPGYSVKATLVGVEGGPLELGEVMLPNEKVNNGKDPTALCIKTVLTSDNDNQPNPLLLNYMSIWGTNLSLEGHTPLTMVASSLKKSS